MIFLPSCFFCLKILAPILFTHLLLLFDLASFFPFYFFSPPSGIVLKTKTPQNNEIQIFSMEEKSISERFLTCFESHHPDRELRQLNLSLWCLAVQTVLS